MLIGIVPRVCPVFSQQSAKSVYPVAIVNCRKKKVYGSLCFHLTVQYSFTVCSSLFVARQRSKSFPGICLYGIVLASQKQTKHGHMSIISSIHRVYFDQ